MRVLVSAASKHGATAEIAERIGAVLRRSLAQRDSGVEVVVRPAQEVGRVDGFDAFVLGSAVYMGHWLESARDLVRRNAETLSGRPVWLFSSGPIGDPPKPDEQPVDVGEAVATTRAREHRLFAGKLNRHRLGLAERAMVLALRAPEGDFRDWAAVEAWARGIADTLGEGR
jgi:menaquinone-dependent protoporphyrinogen oxidase